MKNQFLKATMKLFFSALVVLSVSLPSFAYGPQQEKMSKMSKDKVEKKKMEKGKMSKMKADSSKKNKRREICDVER
ncbi:hypothetical protein [Pedobacter sp. Leaf194]|uniref:hypothetical protein n=1 Tax=Pedobacter sp. Leaf194 TaxID=1736297 RepID=UPI000703AAE4|nr:hypothetical protein [Pedobacter sp. Leaf194]